MTMKIVKVTTTAKSAVQENPALPMKDGRVDLSALTPEFSEAFIIIRSDGTTVSLYGATYDEIEDYHQQQLKRAKELEEDARLTGIQIEAMKMQPRKRDTSVKG